MAALSTALLLAACVPPQPAPIERFGGADDLIERLEIDPSDRPLTHLDLALARTASVLVLYVVPARGAAVIYPASDEMVAPLSAGVHRIALTTPAVTRALRRAAQLGSLGELLVVATERPLDAAAVRERIGRVALSTDRREAVVDATRAVLAASSAARWSALTARTWLLPSDAHTRGLLRMPRAQRAADVF